MIRRGALLLEALVALAIFVAAGLAILSVMRQGSSDARAWRERMHALDLARSALSQIEAGIATSEQLNGPVPAWEDEEETTGAAFEDFAPAPSGWRLEVRTEPGGVGGATLVTVRAYRDRLNTTGNSLTNQTSGAGVTLRQLIHGIGGANTSASAGDTP